MSFPIVYPQPESLAIPSSLVGEELKAFKGARNVIKAIPASSGQASGPSSTIQFSIPTGGNAFIKPNSMYLRAKVLVTIAGAANVGFKFAGNSYDDSLDVGGASSLINRINVNLAGTVMTYQNYNHFRNAVLPHSLNATYFQTDLRQLEYCGVSKDVSVNDDASKTMYVSIPLWLPIFNSQQAFPTLLLKSPITMELLTETVNNAFASKYTNQVAGTVPVTGYSLSDLYLVYEEIQVSPEFKSALVSSKAGQMYNISVNDWWSMGPTNADQKIRYQVGCNMSSLKGILFTEQLAADTASALVEKKYTTNGLTNYTIYVDNFPVSIPNITDDSAAFGEMNRAIQRVNDPTVNSIMTSMINTASTGLRNSYTTHNFLAGTSTLVISDWGYSSCGIPASTVTLELDHNAGATSAPQWQNTTAWANGASLYSFLLNDTIVSIDVSQGIVTVRK